MARLLIAVRSLFLNCRESVRLQSGALDRPLPPLQRLGLRIHLFLCVWCRRYGKQIRFLRSIVRYEEHHSRLSAEGLSPEARERIKRALESAKK